MSNHSQTKKIPSKRSLNILSNIFLITYALGVLWFILGLNHIEEHDSNSVNGVDPSGSFSCWLYTHIEIGMLMVPIGIAGALFFAFRSDKFYARMQMGTVTKLRAYVVGEDPAGNPRSEWLDVPLSTARTIKIGDTYPWAK